MGGFTRGDLRWILVRLFWIAATIAALLLLVYILGALKPPTTPASRSAPAAMEQLSTVGRVEGPSRTP